MTVRVLLKTVDQRRLWSGVAALSLALAFWPRHGLWSACLGEQPLLPPDWLVGWSLAPEILLPLAVLGGVLLFGSRKGERSGAMLGWGLLLLALLSPLCRLAATLLSVHMLQFLLLTVAAPLLLLRVWRGPSLQPGSAALLYGAMIWLWHLPWLYGLILGHAAAHLLAVMAALLLSLSFWHSLRVAAHLRPLAAFGALLFTLLHTGMLGAWLTFAPVPGYPLQQEAVAAWGLSLLQDQQLAGLLMWVVGGAAYVLAALLLCRDWLRRLMPAGAARGELGS